MIFMGPSSIKKKKAKNIDNYNPDWTYCYLFIIILVIFGVLILREIKIVTFLWVLTSKRVLGPVTRAHCA